MLGRAVNTAAVDGEVWTTSAMPRPALPREMLRPTRRSIPAIEIEVGALRSSGSSPLTARKASEAASSGRPAAGVSLGSSRVDVVAVEAELVVYLALLGIAEDVVRQNGTDSTVQRPRRRGGGNRLSGSRSARGLHPCEERGRARLGRFRIEVNSRNLCDYDTRIPPTFPPKKCWGA